MAPPQRTQMPRTNTTTTTMSSHDLEFNVDGAAGGTVDPSTYAAPAGMMDNANDSNNKGMAALVKQSAHPTVCLFHVLFKGLALFLYIFGGFFAGDSGANFVTITVFCILLLSADFWVVKNVTGRLLVGLRWWNQVEGDTNKWIFESSQHNDKVVNRFDSRVFWTILYATPVVWGGLFVIGILKLEIGWLITVCMALTLSSANVYGYYKCSSDQKAKFQQMMQQGAQAGAMSMLRSGLFGVLGGASTSNNTQETSYA